MGFLKFLGLDRPKASFETPQPPLGPRIIRRTRDEHLFGPGPKRILALDGGGVRGALAIGVLERIETILRARHGNDPDFRLADYFDLVGGTSTGAIIAAALVAKRYKADEVRRLYFDLAPKIFSASGIRIPGLHALFDGKALLKILEAELGEATLGAPSLSTGLAVVTKRLDTMSTWVLHNNPRGAYFEPGTDTAGRAYTGNKDYPLAEVVRASTAAPYFFEPESVEIGPGQTGLFIDGGLTPHNNPALQLLMLATMAGHRLQWPTGADNLLIVSIGTGSLVHTRDSGRLERALGLKRTVEALTAMISGAEDHVETMMQWLGHSFDPVEIDSEVGTLAGEPLAGTPLFSYQRYNIALRTDAINDGLGLQLTDAEIKTLRNMTKVAATKISYEVGQRLGAQRVKPEHFPAAFDLSMAGAHG